MSNKTDNDRHKLMNILGMFAVGLAEFLSNTEDAITILSNLNISQLLWGGYLVHLFICILWWNILKCNDNQNTLGNWYGNKPYIFRIWLYGLIQFIDVFCWWYGIKLIPFGDAYCIITTSHLITVFVAHIWLKERLFKLFIPTLIIAIIATQLRPNIIKDTLIQCLTA